MQGLRISVAIIKEGIVAAVRSFGLPTSRGAISFGSRSTNSEDFFLTLQTRAPSLQILDYVALVYF